MTHLLTIGKTDIPYTIRYSAQAARKRVVVTPAGVEVIAPVGTALEGADGLEAFVNSKRRWVFNAVRAIAEKHQKLLTQRYASGAKLQYKGRWLMLEVRRGDVAQVEVACRSKFHVVVPAELEGLEQLEAIRAGFDRWLRARALRDLRRFGRRHEVGIGAKAEGYRLSDAKSRWGSCGRDQIIRVHWRMVQAPVAAMEYVVAHEVAHLVERSHSPAFWELLARTMPDWLERKGMLERWERAHRAV